MKADDRISIILMFIYVALVVLCLIGTRTCSALTEIARYQQLEHLRP